MYDTNTRKVMNFSNKKKNHVKKIFIENLLKVY